MLRSGGHTEAGLFLPAPCGLAPQAHEVSLRILYDSLLSQRLVTEEKSGLEHFKPGKTPRQGTPGVPWSPVPGLRDLTPDDLRWS